MTLLDWASEQAVHAEKLCHWVNPSCKTLKVKLLHGQVEMHNTADAEQIV